MLVVTTKLVQGLTVCVGAGTDYVFAAANRRIALKRIRRYIDTCASSEIMGEKMYVPYTG